MDDNEDSRYAVRLQLGDFDVIEVGDGPAALQAAEEVAPDCILLDVEMPGMNGFEVCRRLRANPACASIPVILLTGHRRDTDSLVTGLAAGADEYIAKPVARAELHARVHAMLRIGDLQRRLTGANERLEEQVRRRTAALLRIYETVPIGLYTMSVMGRLTSVNHALQVMLGRELDDLTGQDASALFGADYDAAYWSALCRERGRIAAELHVVGADDQVVAVLDERVWNADGSGFTGYVQDRTQREQLESVLQEQEKQAAIGRLAGGIMHEIINPLAGVQHYLGAVAARLETGATVDTQELQRGMVVMQDAVDRATKLVGNLRGFTRVAERPRDDVDLVAIVEDLGLLLRHDLDRHRIKLIVEGQRGEAIVRADEGQVSQVLVNLFTNARDAMQDGGTLTARVRVENQEVHLAVADTGTGIPPDIQDRVFELLFTTKGDAGTGYGLAISRRIALDHGGSLDFESQPGAGSTFHLRLPCA